jgi:CHAT domain-containing protein
MRAMCGRNGRGAWISVSVRGALSESCNGKEIESFATIVQRQGAAAVIATLWSVADESTAVFMKRFYELEELKKGLSKATALSMGQREFIQGWRVVI